MSRISSESDSNSWINGLAEFLWHRQDIEAIDIDTEKKSVSVGTVGELDIEELRRCLQETIVEIEKNLGHGGGHVGTLPKGMSLEQKEGQLLLKTEKADEDGLTLVWREMPWPEVESEEEGEHEHEEDWRFLSFMAGLCGFSGLMGFVLQTSQMGPSWLPIVCYLVAIIAGGWDAAKDVFHDLPKGHLDIHFLMLAVAGGATAIGAWREGALLLFLFSLSGALEQFAKYRTRKSIDSLFQAAPKTATVVDRGGEEEVPVAFVRAGQVVLVKPGQLFPVDGEVVSGKTAADESTLTGEAHPVEKVKGGEVFSGTMNLWGVVEVRVTRPAKESSLQKIIKLIQEAQHLKAPSQRFTDKFGTPYTYFILGLVTVMFFVWWLWFDVNAFTNIPNSYSAFYRAMTLLVVASPCALVLSIPSAILAAIAWGASHGVLFRGGAAIEKLSQVDVVALDKTGTLTTGELQVIKVESFPEGKETEVLEMAYSLEKSSTHPIARAIVKYGKDNGVGEHAVVDFKSIAGSGVQGSIKEGVCVLGRRGLLEMGPLKEWAKKLPAASEEFSEVWVVQGELIGRILLKDSIREQSRPILAKLRELGIKTIMLTGDRREAAEAVGKELGVQEVRYGLKPEDKVKIINELARKGKKVAMVGDGVNDAPSLAAAFVPVGMGARGSDAALEQSEVVLMNDRIDYFLDAYRLSVRAHKIIKINLAISLASIIIMVVAGSFGVVPLTLGVLTHEGSTVFVCLNSLRLLYKK